MNTLLLLPLPGLPPATCPRRGAVAFDLLGRFEQRCPLDADHDGPCRWEWVELEEVS